MTMIDPLGRSRDVANNIQSENLGVPDTAGTAVHAPIAGNDASNSFTTGITNPDVPRNLTYTAGATWDGGDVTVAGRNRAQGAVTETITAAALVAGPVVGSVPFASITSITKGAVGAAAQTVAIDTGARLGLSRAPAVAVGIIAADGVIDPTATFDATNATADPAGTPPDGSRSFAAMYPSAGPS